MHFFQHVSKAAAAFMLVTAMAVGLTNCSNSNTSRKDSLLNDAEELEQIDNKIAQLESKKAKEVRELEKAKTNRNKNLGMMVGLSYQPSTGLSEITYWERKINSVDKRISQLNTQKTVLMAKLAKASTRESGKLKGNTMGGAAHHVSNDRYECNSPSSDCSWHMHLYGRI